MTTQIEVAEGTPADRPFVIAHHRALVIGSRTAMLMLLIAALAVLGLGIFALIRGGGAGPRHPCFDRAGGDVRRQRRGSSPGTGRDASPGPRRRRARDGRRGSQ